jgi:hypothetical protein
VAGQWFSPGTAVSSTNKTDHHDLTEILLKVALTTITLIFPLKFVKKGEKKNPALVVFLLLIVTYINFSVMNTTFNSEGKSGLLHQTVK